jgi:hypothetical protein
VPRRVARRGLLGVVLAGAMLLAGAPSPAGAFTKAIWGGVYRNGVNQFPLYRQLGAGIYEAVLNWTAVAPTRPRRATNPRDPAYRWPAMIQQAVTQAGRFHMRVMLMLIGTPPWANGNRAWNWVPKRPADFADFATAAAREYPSVHLWMIWGEPSRSPNFQPLYPAAPDVTRLSPRQQIAPHNYARLLDGAYGSLKRVSRKNVVIGGATYTSGDIDTQQWVENLRLPNGRPPRMDMYAHNPFTTTDPSFNAAPTPHGYVAFNDLPRLAQWVDRYLHRGLPLFLSEWTVPTCPDQEFSFYVDPLVAARWVTDALRLSRHWQRIYALGWAHPYDIPGATCGGLMTDTGQRKPLFQAFARG